MCCTGHASGDLQPARYPDQSTELRQAPGFTAKKHRKKRPSQKAPGTSTPAVDIQTVTAEAPVTTAGNLPHDVMFQFDLTAENTEGANMANGATLFDINMGLDAPLSTPSGLFLPDDMCLGGPIEDGIGVGSLQLDDDLFPCWDQGVNFGALETQTFSPGPMMSNLYGGPSDLGGLLDGVLDNPSTPPCAIDWAGQLSSAESHHTDDVEGYSNSSPSQLLEAGPSQGIGTVLGGPPRAVSTSPTLTRTKRKAVDCESDKLPRKKGRPATNPNVAIHCNSGPAGHEAATRRVSDRVAAKLAEEAATKAKAAKAKRRTQARGSSRK